MGRHPGREHMQCGMTVRLLTGAVVAALPLWANLADAAQLASATELARGKYLVVIGGCNDCHTPGYAPTHGQGPEKGWLIRDRLGSRGPRGSTYTATLRR